MSWSKRRKWLGAAVALGVGLLAVRLALPGYITKRINEELAELPNYSGHLEDVDLHLWRGAYALDGLVIRRRGSELDTPFLQLRRLDITVHWKALWAGEVVGELDAHGLQVAFVQGESEAGTQLGEGLDWRAQIERLYPFRFNRIDTHDALLSFQAPGIEAKQRMELTGLDVHVRDLTNITEKEKATFAGFDATGQVMDSGRLELSGSLDPNAETPTFDLDFELRDVRLPEVNAWLREYAGVDAEAGQFGLYAEVAARQQAFDGYVKPVIRDADILDLDEDAGNPFRVAWEALVAAVAAVLQNPPKDQLATRIPLEGEFDDPDADVLTAIFNVLRNAFVSAFSAAIDHSISIQDVKPSEGNGSDEASGNS